MSKKKPERKKTGRPPGSLSYVGVRLKDLTVRLTPDAIIKVDRRFANQLFGSSLTIEPGSLSSLGTQPATIEVIENSLIHS